MTVQVTLPFIRIPTPSQRLQAAIARHNAACDRLDAAKRRGCTQDVSKAQEEAQRLNLARMRVEQLHGKGE